MRKLAHGCAAVAALSVVLTGTAFGAPRAAAAGGPATPGAPLAAAARAVGRPARAAERSLDSYNWPGYAAARAGRVFRYVRAEFFVPYADCRETPGASSSHWVGLDGLGNGSVEQLGVAIRCAGSKPRYYAWYEMYPKLSG
jgi:Peptidase A4 family